MLATVLATPCTAPFLGAALGFAFAQPPAIIVLMFLAVGAGLAAPYVVLSWQPAWLKFLPKPGAWMEQFKIAMGFPMLATAVWLFSLHAVALWQTRRCGSASFSCILALAAWIYGEFVQRGRSPRGLALAVALVLLVGGYALRRGRPVALALAGRGHRRVAGSLKEGPDGIDWQRWSPGSRGPGARRRAARCSWISPPTGA